MGVSSNLRVQTVCEVLQNSKLYLLASLSPDDVDYASSLSTPVLPDRLRFDDVRCYAQCSWVEH